MQPIARVGLLALVALTGPQATANELSGYPHRVEIDYAEQSLVCPVRSAGGFNWSDKAALPGQAAVPEGAAGAVLWSEGPPPVGAMLQWEHPVHNPTTGEYVFRLSAQYTRGRGPVLQIQAAQRPASRRSENRASGTGAQIGGVRTQSTEAAVFDPIPTSHSRGIVSAGLSRFGLRARASTAVHTGWRPTPSTTNETARLFETFELPYPPLGQPYPSHVVADKGRRFIKVEPIDRRTEAHEPSIQVIENWHEEFPERKY